MTAFRDKTDDQLLDLIQEERLPLRLADGSYRTADYRLVRAMVDELILRGVYPKKPVAGNPNDVYTMIEGWGARWHLWKEPHNCPHCGTDLRDLKVGPPFKREIGIYSDSDNCTSYFECPDCKERI